MDRVAALLRSKGVVAGIVVLVLAVGGGFVWWATGGSDDDAEPAAAPSASSSTTTPPTSATTSPTPSPVETSDVPCEGPDTVLDSDGDQQQSLLPDCGHAPVTAAQEKKTGLGLGCGGKYPVILYKTETDEVDSSICGRDSSGADLRVVIKKDGEATRDLDGRYDYTVDGFVAKDGDTTWTVQAYNGAVKSTRNGKSATTPPGDWQSLDNEPDGD